jgi:hypothetical protein
MPRHAVLRFVAATTLRWFPPLRFAWGFRGEQTAVKITGRNAKRVWFGAINPRTGHRLVFRRYRQGQEDFQAFLRYLRQHYPGRPLWLLLDKAPCPDAARSQQRAARLGIVLLWLPKQGPERNAMDQRFQGPQVVDRGEPPVQGHR